MNLILQIETATTSCSIALAKNGQVLGFKEINQRNIHAEVITVFVEELINASGYRYNDIDAMAVSSGPGSYTGLRIGVSTAKGLCFALDKPLIAIETLTAMANGAITMNLAGDDDTLLCPMIDARRMEVYTAVFNAAGGRITATVAEIIDSNSFKDLLKSHKMLFFGDGADKCRTVLGETPNALFYPDFINSATFLTEIAAEKFTAKDFVDVAYFEPYYLKEFIAGKKAL